jgi:hypothetical protein
MKTEFLYKEISMFMAEFPSTVNGRKLDNVLQFLQLEQNNLLENPRILSQERNMAPDIKDKPV